MRCCCCACSLRQLWHHFTGWLCRGRNLCWQSDKSSHWISSRTRITRYRHHQSYFFHVLFCFDCSQSLFYIFLYLVLNHFLDFHNMITFINYHYHIEARAALLFSYYSCHYSYTPLLQYFSPFLFNFSFPSLILLFSFLCSLFFFIFCRESHSDDKGHCEQTGTALGSVRQMGARSQGSTGYVRSTVNARTVIV